MKGFASIIALFAVIIISITFLGLNKTTEYPQTHNEEFLKAKQFFTNYEMIIAQVVTDCNWVGQTNEQKLVTITACIDSNTQLMFSTLSEHYPRTFCQKENDLTLIKYNNYPYYLTGAIRYTIDCNTIIGNPNEENYFEMKFRKQVNLYKAN